jgi:hypothetical protein
LEKYEKNYFSLKLLRKKTSNLFYLCLALAVTFLFFCSSASSAPIINNKQTDISPIDEDYIKAKISVEKFFEENSLKNSVIQIGTMKKKELTIFKNFMVYCSSFMDLFLKGSHVLYQCRISQRHFNFQYSKGREVDWLMDQMLTGISYVHDEFGGSRFKEDFIMRKRNVEREWIRAINQRFLQLEGELNESPKA